MLDLRLIREHPEDVQRALAEKGGADLVPEILARDSERRRRVKEAEDLKAQRNVASEAIGRAKKRGEDASAEQARMREVGERIKTLDAEHYAETPLCTMPARFMPGLEGAHTYSYTPGLLALDFVKFEGRG